MKKIIIGISGASGVIYGIRLLEVLREQADVETHLVMSTAAATTIGLETDQSPEQIMQLADVVYRFRDIAATIASGSGSAENRGWEEAGLRLAPLVEQQVLLAWRWCVL